MKNIKCSKKIEDKKKIFNIINITIYSKNLIVGFHVFYTFNTHVKFCVSRIFFTILSINLYFINNFKLQKLANLKNLLIRCFAIVYSNGKFVKNYL